MTEFSREIYDTYLVNTEDSTYMMRNTSWLMMFTRKDTDFGIMQSMMIHEKLDTYFAAGFRCGLVDKALDDELTQTFGVSFDAQLFVLDNETQMAYSWEYDRPVNETLDWVLNRTYRNSAYQFKIPRTLYEKEYTIIRFYNAFKMWFNYQYGLAMERWMFVNLPVWLIENTPITLISNWDGNDIFLFKLKNKIIFVALVILSAILSMVQIMRILCCTSIRYVKPKRLIDKDD